MAIDDKLKEIQLNKEVFEMGALDDEAIDQIKQAFKDERPDVKRFIEIMDKSYMTGQEWFDRYVKECLALPKDHNFTDMLDAAKRAAGLEKGSN